MGRTLRSGRGEQLAHEEGWAVPSNKAAAQPTRGSAGLETRPS